MLRAGSRSQERTESFTYLLREGLSIWEHHRIGTFSHLKAVLDAVRAETKGRGKVANNKPYQHCYLSKVGSDLHCFDQT